MTRLALTSDRRFPAPLELLLTINAGAMVLVALWFRCRWLGNLPGVNADETWYGVKALQLLRGQEVCLLTPTGNPLNPFFFGPLVLLHACFDPSIVLLRWLALGSGVAALAINWLLCRWVFDRRTAAISTVLLALLPINIAYSRFAWDASQSLAATLPVLYLSLAAVRQPQRKGRFILAAVLAQLAAVAVHPTNIFAGAAIVAALAGCPRPQEPKPIESGGVIGRWKPAGLVLATILLLILAVHWARKPGPSRFVSRMGDVRELTRTQATSHFAILYPRLFTGGTVYQYIAGSHSWFEWPCRAGKSGWGIDVVTFWLLLGAVVWCLWRSSKTGGRTEDRVLLSAWALGLVVFFFLAGPRALMPGWERWAICLVGPTVVLAARGLTLCSQVRKPNGQWVLAAASLIGWLVLADYQVHYFDFIRRTGGCGHRTFRTGAVEPKQAAVRTILQQRGAGPTWIVTSEWWNRWPLQYLGMAEDGIRVVTPAEAEASAQFESARRQGRVWYVEFDGSKPLEELRAVLAGRKADQWQFADFSGQPVLCVLHPSADAELPRQPALRH
jgi:hypothetical protein